LLAYPPADLLRDQGLLDSLTKLQDEPRVSAGLKARIAAVLSVRSYLAVPALTAESMSVVAAALAVSPPAVPASARDELFAAVATELHRRAKSDTLQADLEGVLVHFGSVLAQDPSKLYGSLLRDLRARTDFGKQRGLVHAFLAVALGATESPELAGKLDGLEGHAFAIASAAAERGGNRVLNDIDRRSEGWPKAVRTQWGFLLAAVRPRGFRGMVRDAGLVVAGAVASTLLWWAAQLAGR
jgi:hypothetical protein